MERCQVWREMQGSDTVNKTLVASIKGIELLDEHYGKKA